MEEVELARVRLLSSFAHSLHLTEINIKPELLKSTNPDFNISYLLFIVPQI